MDTGDTTQPRVICLTHGSVRYCREHRRSEFPPDAAKKWLRKNCSGAGEQRLHDCEIVYRAGLMPRGLGIG